MARKEDKQLSIDRLKEIGHELLESYVSSTAMTKFRCKYCLCEFFAKPYRLISGHKKSCGCFKTEISKDKSGYALRRRGGRFVSMTLFSHIKQGAAARNIDFIIDTNYLDELLESQNFKCALSGKELIHGYQDLDKISMSLDRIDSTIGYVVGNVQWVTKEINMAKQGLRNEDFIRLCSEVAVYAKR